MYVNVLCLQPRFSQNLLTPKPPLNLKSLGVFQNTEVPVATVVTTTAIANNDCCATKAMRIARATFGELPATVFAHTRKKLLTNGSLTKRRDAADALSEVSSHRIVVAVMALALPRDDRLWTRGRTCTSGLSHKRHHHAWQRLHAHTDTLNTRKILAASLLLIRDRAVRVDHKNCRMCCGSTANHHK